MNQIQVDRVSVTLELAIKLYKAAINDISVKADDVAAFFGCYTRIRPEPSGQLKALGGFLAQEESDKSNENFLLRLTEAIWAYSNVNPPQSARLYRSLVHDVIYQYCAKTTAGKISLSESCIKMTERANRELIVSATVDSDSRKSIMTSAAEVQASVGKHGDDELSENTWLLETLETKGLSK
ncbi:hypothetical protein Aspvir_009358 [Aspergillus viridinutans]|uniref:Uncharacterized protein n=1 Tax=Aspergillus viridinutans TaxID=75553 RepID=A0A9P3BZV9_ASPVI|nr:uncharacterized protein Aspvir_009358 [Aspergillus viridinutans]GIK05254.1 hypothetical protein Aspvir_009358 [Aspergillus viridinutans]